MTRIIITCLVLFAVYHQSYGQLFGPLMSLAGGLSNLNPFQGLANSLSGSGGGGGGLLSSLRGSASSLAGISAGPTMGPMVPPPPPPPPPFPPFGGFGNQFCFTFSQVKR